MKNMLGLNPAARGTKDFPHFSDHELGRGASAIYLENDTFWRIVSDLHRALLYTDRASVLQAQPQQRYLALVDGIQAGGTNFLEPTLHAVRAVLIADHPATADAIGARLMGFDPRKIRSLVQTTAWDSALGTMDPKAIAISTSPSLQSLSQAFTAGTIVPPDVGTVSWQGRIEASDFEPPRFLNARRDPTTGHLEVQVVDNSGVAAVRAYGPDGTQFLQLVRGTVRDGLWKSTDSRRAELLEAWDLVFNSSQTTMT